MSFANLTTKKGRVGLREGKSDVAPEHKKDLILSSLALSDHVRCTLADRERNYNR